MSSSRDYRRGQWVAQFADGTVKTESAIKGGDTYTHAFRVVGRGDRGHEREYGTFATSLRLAKQYAAGWAQYVTEPEVEIVPARLVLPKAPRKPKSPLKAMST